MEVVAVDEGGDVVVGWASLHRRRRLDPDRGRR